MKIAVVTIGLCVLGVQYGCGASEPPSRAPEFCGTSFCVTGVPNGAVQTSSPVSDVCRYVISTAADRIYLLEINFPDLDGLKRMPVQELSHLKAWHLSPKATPHVLIYVGAKWPHWILAAIDGDASKGTDLVKFLQRLRITAITDDTPEGSSSRC